MIGVVIVTSLALFLQKYFLGIRLFFRFCVVIRSFHPRHNGQWPPTLKDFYLRFCQFHFSQFLRKSQYFPCFNVEC